MILMNMKNQIKISYIFSAFIALFVTVISIGDIQNTIQYKGIMFVGLSFLFLIFSNEILKESLIEEKRSKRLEFLMGNGVSINSIFINYLVSTYLLTTLLLIPSFLYIIIIKKALIGLVYPQIIELLFINFIMLSINILLVLYLKNLNTIRNIFLLLTFILSLYNGLKFTVKELYPAYTLGFIGISAIVLMVIGWLVFYNLTKERVIDSYS